MPQSCRLIFDYMCWESAQLLRDLTVVITLLVWLFCVLTLQKRNLTVPFGDRILTSVAAKLSVSVFTCLWRDWSNWVNSHSLCVYTHPLQCQKGGWRRQSRERADSREDKRSRCDEKKNEREKTTNITNRYSSQRVDHCYSGFRGETALTCVVL